MVYGCPVTTRTTMRSVVVGLTIAVATAAMARPVLASGTVPPEGSEGAEGLTVVETLGLFVLAPLVIFAVIALAVLGPSFGKGARHRTGAGFDSAPVWVGSSGPVLDEPVLGDPSPDLPERGGASGRW